MTECQAILKWSKACYAVDVTGDTLIAVRAERTHGGVSFTPVSPAALSLKKDGEKGVPVVACLNASQSFTRQLEAPFSARDKAEKVFPTILDIQLPFALEDCTCCFLNTSKTDRNTFRTLAVVARMPAVKKKLAFLKTKDIDPLVLDQEGIALWTQSLKESPPTNHGSNSPRAIVFLGRDRATLVIGRGKEFISSHKINIDMPEQINRILHSQLGPEVRGQESGGRDQPPPPKGYGEPRASASSIQNPASRIPHPASLNWFWTGPEAIDSRLVSKIREKISENWSGPSAMHDKPDTFLARAIATRALTPGPLRCNLRSGNLTHSRVIQKTARQQMAAAVFFLLCGIILCAANVVSNSIVNWKNSEIDESFASLRDNLYGSAGLKDVMEQRAIQGVRQKLDENSRLLKPFLNAFEPSLAKRIRSMKDIAIERGLRYDEMFLSHDKVLVKGTGSSWGACDSLADYLAKYGYEVVVRQNNALADERIPFVIETGRPE